MPSSHRPRRRRSRGSCRGRALAAIGRCGEKSAAAWSWASGLRFISVSIYYHHKTGVLSGRLAEVPSRVPQGGASRRWLAAGPQALHEANCSEVLERVGCDRRHAGRGCKPPCTRRADGKDHGTDRKARLDSGGSRATVRSDSAAHERLAARPYLALFSGCAGEHRVGPGSACARRTVCSLTRRARPVKELARHRSSRASSSPRVPETGDSTVSQNTRRARAVLHPLNECRVGVVADLRAAGEL